MQLLVVALVAMHPFSLYMESLITFYCTVKKSLFYAISIQVSVTSAWSAFLSELTPSIVHT